MDSFNKLTQKLLKEHGLDPNCSRSLKSDLFKINEYSEKIHDAIPDDARLPGWMEGHIFKASEMLSEVWHKMKYEMETNTPQPGDEVVVSQTVPASVDVQVSPVSQDSPGRV